MSIIGKNDLFKIYNANEKIVLQWQKLRIRACYRRLYYFLDSDFLHKAALKY